jgi:hypothetical protein
MWKGVLDEEADDWEQLEQTSSLSLYMMVHFATSLGG